MKNNPIRLQSLLLKNFATFDDTTIHFHKNFNTIIGETGSGKSLILDALQLILGQRADKKFIRKNAEFAIIEANFKVDSQLKNTFFDDLGHPCDSDELVIKRIIYRTGTSKSYMNFQQCPLSTLQNFAQEFIDLVGQFENQKLLDPFYQISLIDAFAQNTSILSAYQEHYKALQEYEKRHADLTNTKQENLQKKDFLQFQIDEYQALATSPEEEQELTKQKESLVNYEENQKRLLSVQDKIDEGAYGISAQLSHLINELETIDDLSEYLDSLSRAKQSLEDISYEVSNRLSSELDQEQLSTVLDRLDRIQKIKRKYNLPIIEIEKIISNYQRDLDSISEVDLELIETEKCIHSEKLEATKLAANLHQSRLKAGKKIEQLITAAIRKLNMSGATIVLNLQESTELTAHGCSKITIEAETNPGEGVFALKQIASGGELSRILLAFRQVLASKDTISIFLFDEIDAGIGGETAMKIGTVLQKVSQDSQVIAITHLPQIAHFADQLLDITKQSVAIGSNSKDLRTFSMVNTIRTAKEKEQYVKKMVPLEG